MGPFIEGVAATGQIPTDVTADTVVHSQVPARRLITLKKDPTRTIPFGDTIKDGGVVIIGSLGPRPEFDRKSGVRWRVYFWKERDGRILLGGIIAGKVRAIGNVVIIDVDGAQQFSDEAEVGSNLSDGYAIGFSGASG